MISINATLILQVIHFLVLALILNRILFRPVLKTLRERDGYMEKTRHSVEEIKKDIHRLRDELTTRLNQAREDASHERALMKNEGIERADGFLNQSREKVLSMRAEAEERAQSEIRKLRPKLEGEAVRLADEIVQKVAGRKLEA